MVTWRQHFHNTNVCKSLMLFNEEQDGIFGPLLLGINSSTYGDEVRVYMEVSEKAHPAPQIVALLLNGRRRVAEPGIGIFLSGCKGHNLEVRPEALGIAGDLDAQLLACERPQAELRDAMKAGGIEDRVDRVF